MHITCAYDSHMHEHLQVGGSLARIILQAIHGVYTYYIS